MTTPPEGTPTQHQPGPHQPGYGYASGTTSMARLPIPGNAEWVVWVVILIVFAIVAAAADTVGAHDWVVATTWLTAAYLLSRGIAKASRVLEH